MHLYTETITLKSSILYTIYQMSFASDVTIDILNPETFEVDYHLDRIGGRYNSLYQTQFAVDNEKGLIFFSSSSVGCIAKITYDTTGEINPFHASENLFSTIARILTWSNKRICDGLYIYSYPDDLDYIKRLERGSFIYNGYVYVCNERVLNFTELSPPRMKNLYRGYYVYINDATMYENLDKKTKSLTGASVLVSSGIHENTLQAKYDVLARYDAMYTSPALSVAYMYQSIRSDNTREIIIDYISESRVL